jgi:predicted Rossmann fold nucleotide-binding protein DprA/Smf involved in DNA uptake
MADAAFAGAASGIAARLRLIRTPSIGPVTYAQLLARFGTAQAALDAIPLLARRGGGRPPVLADPRAIAAEIARVAERATCSSTTPIIRRSSPSSKTRRPR